MSVYPRLHRILAIPGNYHIECPILGIPQRPVEPLDGLVREQAIRELRAAGELRGEDDTEALLSAICRKLTKLNLPPAKKETKSDAARVRVREKSGIRPKKEADRLARKMEIMAALVADPDVKISHLAREFKADIGTVRGYRQQLRNAGKIT